MTIEEYVQYMSDGTSEWDWELQQYIIDKFAAYPSIVVITVAGRRIGDIIEAIRIERPEM